MKKYSQSPHRKKNSQKILLAAEKRLVEEAVRSGGSGDQSKDTGVKILLQSSSELLQTRPELYSKNSDDEIYLKCDTNSNTNMPTSTIGDCQDDQLSQRKSPTSTLQSTSDCDSTQLDITSTSMDSSTDAVQPSLPLNCVWGNGMQFQTTYDLSHTTVRYPVQTAPTRVSVPVIQIPHVNPRLPFPDRSGGLNPIASYGIQGSMLHPPAPTLNASLGFPSVYVSPAGLITVLLKYDIAVEMTVDKNIRVVNHRHKAVAATNNRGSSSCVYHVGAKIFQDGTNTEIEVFGERRARMQTNGILFASGVEVYLLDENHIVPSQFVFNDMSKDCSVNILYTPAMVFTNDLLINCDEITKNSRYYFHKDGSTTIIINNIKIHQDEHGEVHVTSGPRYISTSPVYGNVLLQTHFVEISVQVHHHSL